MPSSLHLLADVASGPVLAVAGLAAFLLLLFGIVLVEAVVLRLLQWAGFGAAFLHALLVNFISAIVGFGFALLDLVPTVWLWLVVAFVLSVAIEGAILLAFRRQHPAGRTWRCAALANLASYLLLALLGLLNGAG